MNRMEYQAPKMEIITFQPQDIITTSGDGGGVDLPLDPASDDGEIF